MTNEQELPTGVYAEFPEGYTPPHPLLTHYCAFEGGFYGWIRLLPDGYLLICTNEEGEDSLVVTGEGSWSICVLDPEVDAVHNSEASPLNLGTALETIVGINWKERSNE